mmetsp:Transcript_4661/g.6581  ORF Transcript_4661/g.6581 Transcript_4661/m.6581 type:complete len:375 (-) Transcript_4661:291-1415(-)
MGTSSRASANARIAYCSMPSTRSACAPTASAQATSAEAPPYTMRLSLMRLRVTHMASCSDRLASSTIILFPPRTRIVTALLCAHCSITIMRSLVVPKATSRMSPARPSFSGASSPNRGTMRPPVAMAISSSSTPPTHRTAGSWFWSSRWLASSSKPHWQMTTLAPLSLHCRTMVPKYSCSRACSRSYASREVMSSLCFVLGLGGSKGQVRMHIRASRTSLGICACDHSLSITMPWMSSVSSSRPPGLPVILIMSKFTSCRSRSATLSTASTAMRAIRSLWMLMIFDDSVVFAVFIRMSVFSRLNSTRSAICASRATATPQASSNPSAMRTGCRPRCSSFSACSSSAPARTTTPVVPSPISSSWLCDSSTSSRAT